MDERDAPARRFVTALAARDFDGLSAAFAPDARFRYLVPPGPGEHTGNASIAAKFRQWFGDADRLEVQQILIEALPDRLSARYRFRVHREDGWEVVEQQTFLDVDEDGRIAAIDLLCSGFRPSPGQEDPRNRPGTVPQPSHDRHAPAEHPSEARLPLTGGGHPTSPGAGAPG